MSGNLNEYTSSIWTSSWAGKGFPVLRGGDWLLNSKEVRCANRDYFYYEYPPRSHDHRDGFRCCKSQN